MSHKNKAKKVDLGDPLPEPTLSDIVQGVAWGKGDANFSRTCPLIVARVDYTGENVLLYDGENSCAATITPEAQETIPRDALPLNGRRVRVAGHAERQNIPDNAPIVIHITHIRVLPGGRLGKPHLDDLVDVAYNRTVNHLLYDSNRDRPPPPQEESDTSTVSVSNSEMNRMFPAILHAAITGTSLPMTKKPRNAKPHRQPAQTQVKAAKKRPSPTHSYELTHATNRRKKTKRVIISSSASSNDSPAVGSSDSDYDPGREVSTSKTATRVGTRGKPIQLEPTPLEGPKAQALEKIAGELLLPVKIPAQRRARASKSEAPKTPRVPPNLIPLGKSKTGEKQPSRNAIHRVRRRPMEVQTAERPEVRPPQETRKQLHTSLEIVPHDKTKRKEDTATVQPSTTKQALADTTKSIQKEKMDKKPVEQTAEKAKKPDAPKLRARTTTPKEKPVQESPASTPHDVRVEHETKMLPRERMSVPRRDKEGEKSAIHRRTKESFKILPPKETPTEDEIAGKTKSDENPSHEQENKVQAARKPKGPEENSLEIEKAAPPNLISPHTKTDSDPERTESDTGEMGKNMVNMISRNPNVFKANPEQDIDNATFHEPQQPISRSTAEEEDADTRDKKQSKSKRPRARAKKRIDSSSDAEWKPDNDQEMSEAEVRSGRRKSNRSSRRNAKKPGDKASATEHLPTTTTTTTVEKEFKPFEDTSPRHSKKKDKRNEKKSKAKKRADHEEQQRSKKVGKVVVSLSKLKPDDRANAMNTSTNTANTPDISGLTIREETQKGAPKKHDDESQQSRKKEQMLAADKEEAEAKDEAKKKEEQRKKRAEAEAKAKAKEKAEQRKKQAAAEKEERQRHRARQRKSRNLRPLNVGVSGSDDGPSLKPTEKDSTVAGDSEEASEEGEIKEDKRVADLADTDLADHAESLAAVIDNIAASGEQPTGVNMNMDIGLGDCFLDIVPMAPLSESAMAGVAAPANNSAEEEGEGVAEKDDTAPKSVVSENHAADDVIDIDAGPSVISVERAAEETVQGGAKGMANEGNGMEEEEAAAAAEGTSAPAPSPVPTVDLTTDENGMASNRDKKMIDSLEGENEQDGEPPQVAQPCTPRETQAPTYYMFGESLFTQGIPNNEGNGDEDCVYVPPQGARKGTRRIS